MSRLPIPGSDDGTWGAILNDFLGVEHDTDGTLKSSGSLAAKADDTAVVHLAGAETIAGAKKFPTGLLLDQGNMVFNGLAYTGVDNTGATDSAAGLQAAIDASPYGARWYLPPGVYRFDSTLTLNRGRSLVGAGYYHLRDGNSGFGDAAWGTAGSPSAFTVGTVIYSTVTSGAAIQVTANGGNNVHAGSQLLDFILVGPGSGTSSGLALGESSPSTRAVIRLITKNIKVCNFSTGMLLQHVNEAGFDVAIQGCTKGVSALTDVNNISWKQLNMQRCTDGFVFEDSGSLTNAFLAPICQNITNIGFTIRGEGHTLLSPYFEEVPTIASYNSATLCAMHNPTVQGSGVKTMTIASGSNFNEFWGLKTNAGAFTITNSALGNLFHGVLVALTDSGSNSWRLDVNNGFVQFPRYQSTTTTGPTMQFGSAFGWRFGASGAQGWQGTGSPESVVTAPVGSVYFRTDGGAGTTFYVKESGSGSTGWVAK